MSIPDEVLAVMGELVAAARNDWENCGWDDVGLNGVVIKQWRDAYYEGCKDMASTIVNRLPKEDQKYAGRKVTESFKAKLKELAAQSRTPQETTAPEGEAS